MILFYAALNGLQKSTLPPVVNDCYNFILHQLPQLIGLVARCKVDVFKCSVPKYYSYMVPSGSPSGMPAGCQIPVLARRREGSSLEVEGTGKVLKPGGCRPQNRGTKRGREMAQIFALA